MLFIFMLVLYGPSRYNLAQMDPTTQSKNLSMPVQYLKGVGGVRAEQFARLDILTVADLIGEAIRRIHEHRSVSALFC